MTTGPRRLSHGRMNDGCSRESAERGEAVVVYVIWLFWVISGLAVAVALALDRKSEQAGGRTRLVIPCGVFVGATLLMLFAGTTPSGRPLFPSLTRIFVPHGIPEAQLQAAQAREDQLAKQLDELRNEEARLRSEAAQSASRSKNDDTSMDLIEPSIGRQVTLLAILLVFLLVDVAALLILTDLSSLRLFGKDAKREEQLASLAALTKLVWNEDYRGALARAASILELKLREAELLDLSYLRSYAAVQVYAFPEAGETGDYRRGILQNAIRDLEGVIVVEPRRGPALYLLALAYSLANRHADALPLFERAKEALAGVTLPFAHNESVCLLNRGEEQLSLC